MVLLTVATFGSNLTRLREKAGFKTAKSLADAIGSSAPVVSRWENDATGLPEGPTLLRLAKALSCSIEELMDGVDPDYDVVRARVNRDQLARLGVRRGADLATAQPEQVIDANGLRHEAVPIDEDVTNYKRADVPIIQEGEASPVGMIWDAGDPRTTEVEYTSRPYDFRESGAYAVVLRGDSMEPILKRGMRLIMSAVQPVGDGDVAYVQLRNGERLVKIATRVTDGWLLTSANPAHPPRQVHVDEVEHIHKVAYVRFLK